MTSFNLCCLHWCHNQCCHSVFNSRPGCSYSVLFWSSSNSQGHAGLWLLCGTLTSVSGFKHFALSVSCVCLEELGHPLCRGDVPNTLLCYAALLCTLTHLLCRGLARLHWRECTLGIPSTRASPVQMPLGYNSPHQDLLWLLYMHFSSQHSSFLMTSCPRSGALRMYKKLKCNENRTLTQGSTKQVTPAPAVGSWEQHWPGVIEHCSRQMNLWQTQTCTRVSASPEWCEEYVVGWAHQKWK